MRASLLFFLALASSVSSTHFLFGVDVKCSLPVVFQFSLQHWEDDCVKKGLWCGFDDDETTLRETFIAKDHLFLYQKGHQKSEAGIFDRTEFLDYENYAKFEHNCTGTGEFFTYRLDLPKTSVQKGLEYIEYTVDLANKSTEW